MSEMRELRERYHMNTSTCNLIKAIQSAGRGETRRRLEAMVNDGRITIFDAQCVYMDAFGGTLLAMPDHRRAGVKSR